MSKMAPEQHALLGRLLLKVIWQDGLHAGKQKGALTNVGAPSKSL